MRHRAQASRAAALAHGVSPGRMAEVPTVKALMRHKVAELRDMLKELGEDTKGKKVRWTGVAHAIRGLSAVAPPATVPYPRCLAPCPGAVRWFEVQQRGLGVRHCSQLYGAPGLLSRCHMRTYTYCHTGGPGGALPTASPGQCHGGIHACCLHMHAAFARVMS